MNPFLNTTFKAARRAGQMMIRAAGSLDAVKVDSKVFSDFAPDVDYSSETILVGVLKEAYPHHRITCEEGGPHNETTAEYEWITGPFDSTINFLHGHPQYAISMTLLRRGVLQEALVYVPERSDAYTVSRGKGALLNDHHIRVSNRIELNRCLIGTSFPVVDQSMMDKYPVILKDFSAKAVGGRHEGMTSSDLCAAAASCLNGFLEFNPKPWNIATDALIVQEAGGIVTDTSGNESWLESGDIVTANPKILAQMLKIISDHQ